METRSLFLRKLPIELRLRIYEDILSFDEPIKLRQVVPGSPHLWILRTNRQIYAEALPVLYDSNSIIVTRNDFCTFTDGNLARPLKRDRARHLVMKSFSRSIICMMSEYRCDVCQPSASGLVRIFTTMMPRLRSVVVDCNQHQAEMKQFTDTVKWDGKFELVRMYSDFGAVAYKLQGPGLEKLDVQFRYRLLG